MLTPVPPEPGSVNVGPREPLSSLIDDFKFNDGFREKIQALRNSGYVGWRRVRGDGNCFFRSVGYGFLERLVTATPQQRMRWLTTFRDNLRELEFQDANERSAHAELVSHVEHLQETGGWEAPRCGECEITAMGLLYRSMRDRNGTLDLAFIRAMRHLCTKFLVQHKHTDPLGSGMSVEVLCTAQGFVSTEDFCRQAILPMGTEAEGLTLGALPMILGTNCRIAYLARQDVNGLIFCDYSKDGSVSEGLLKDDDDAPVVHVQFRPGHYDLVYHGGRSAHLLRQPTFGDYDGLEYLLEDDPPEGAAAETNSKACRRASRRRRKGWCL